MQPLNQQPPQVAIPPQMPQATTGQPVGGVQSAPNMVNAQQNATVTSAPSDQAKATQKHPNSTQNSLRFSELRENMVIMGDGSFRAIIAAQSINFELMSARERESVEIAYQDFLNALTFPVQIYIRSERVDIGPYLNKLSMVRSQQDNMLLGVLMDDYINFIHALSQEANIMDKSFFVIIPYSIDEKKQKMGDSSSDKGIFAKMFRSNNNKMRIRIPADQYAKAKEEITNRCNSVMSGLSQAGVKSVRLKTKELGELYYNVYNPDTAIRQPIGDFRNYTADAIKKGEGEAKINPLGIMYGN